MKKGTPVFLGIIIGVVLTVIVLFGFSALAGNGGNKQENPSPTETLVPTSAPIEAATSPFGDASFTDLAPSAVNSPVALRTATPTPTKTATVAQPTKTAVPTQILPTATPTARPATATPTQTQTPTPAPPTATPTAVNTPTPTVPPIPYSLQGISWQPNCGTIRIILKVVDTNNNPVDGVVFRYETRDGMNTALSNPTGTNDPGTTDFTVNPFGTIAATWRVWVVDSSNNPLTAKVDVTSNTTGCKTGDGHQVATVTFVKNY